MFKPQQVPAARRGPGRGRPAVTIVVVPLLYIVAFALFILGLSGLTGPRTAVRGNKIAAVGMLVAVLATLLTVRHNWLLIIVGLVVGAALGVPSARRVRMTAMPQMVALFNGVGGGAVALIAWSEFRTTDALRRRAAVRGDRLAVRRRSSARCRSGARSWRSASSRRSCPAARSGLGRAQQAVNLLLLAGAAACATSAAIGGAELWMVGLLVLAAALGVMVVLPIGGADMPVVISLLNALTGLSAAAAGLALGNTAMIVAGMIVGASGHDPDQPHGHRHEPLDPGDRRGRVRRDVDGAGRGRRGGPPRHRDHGRRRRHPDGLRLAGDRRARVRHGRRPGPARGQGHGGPAGGARRRGQVRDPPGGRPHARAHERAARRGRRALRRAARDGRDQRRVPADGRRRW